MPTTGAARPAWKTLFLGALLPLVPAVNPAVSDAPAAGATFGCRRRWRDCRGRGDGPPAVHRLMPDLEICCRSVNFGTFGIFWGCGERADVYESAGARLSKAFHRLLHPRERRDTMHMPRVEVRKAAMDGTRFDAMTQGLLQSHSRRSALGIAAALLVGRALPGLASHRSEDAPRRRNACQVRCGLEQRQCKLECRTKGVAEKECKRLCKVTREGCFLRCEFRGPRDRWGTGRKEWLP